MFSILRYSYILLYGIGLSIFGYLIIVHEYMQLFVCNYNINCSTFANSYDYIIVGSGTAGSITALRLATGGHSVLILEAGPYDNFLLNIPAISPLLQKSNVDWQYYTEPQDAACKGLINNSSRWPMGRIFGGSVHLNNMLYTRGHERDFENWFKDKENYNYHTDVLPYFKRSENQIGSYKTDDKYHSTGGPLTVNDMPFFTRLSDALLEAANSLGYTEFTRPQVNMKNGKRSTPANIFREKRFKNIKILTNAKVTKILFANSFEATSILFEYFAKQRAVHAKKAIVLSAGVIGTPKILLTSGIGPKYRLESVGIKVHKDLAVGENLQDHITTGLDLISLNTTLPLNMNEMLSFESIYDYFAHGKGPWTSVGCEVVGFLSKSAGDIPGLQLMVLPIGLTFDSGLHLQNTIGLKLESWKYFQKLLTNQTISILPVLLHPKSKGNVYLRDSNPNSLPVIDAKYLSDSSDVKTIIEGIEFIKTLIRTKPMQKLGARINEDKFPGCESHEFDTYQYWECYVRHLTLTSFHPVGTCRMGHPADVKSVVDYKFKVIGTNKLFIADASVMPSLPSANVNAAVAMMAEKAADSIREYEYMNKEVSYRYEILYKQKYCRYL